MRPGEVRALPFAEWAGLRRAGIDAEAEEQRNRFVDAAFIAWQMGSGGKTRFGEYLQRLGLTESRPRTSKLQARASLHDAARIAAADRRQRERNGESV